jgi:hypothetical protein
MTTEVGVAGHDRLDWDDPATFDVEDGVVGADGERELELVDAAVEITPVADGPRLAAVDAALGAAADAGILARDSVPIEES